MTTEQRIADFLRAKGITMPAAAFVGMVSNQYHAIEAEIYDAKHSDIKDTSRFWHKMLNAAGQELPSRVRVLDVGCGTGFASQQVVDVLGSRITHLTCIDHSPEMVSIAREKLKFAQDRATFVCGEIKSLRGEFDLIVTNALLHHILDISTFLTTLGVLLRPHGLYIAGHEPNAAFYRNPVLLRWSKAVSLWKRMRRRLSYARYFRHGSTRGGSGIEAQVNAKLLEQGMIPYELPPGAISRLVDIHVPPLDPSEPFWGERGFDPEELCAGSLPGFTVVTSLTYSHIKDTATRNNPVRGIAEEYLRHRYPADGADIMFMLRRTESIP